MVQKDTRKGLLLPIFFEKIMLIGLAVGVIFWIIYSSINTEEVSVIMRQERNDVEMWNQVLKSDIFRAGADTASGSGKTDYLMYFDRQKIQTTYDQTKTGIYGDISCSNSNPVARCIHFYPTRYYLRIEVGTDTWEFTNGIAADFPVSDSDFKYAEAVGVLEPPKENPTVGIMRFQADFYD